ncbi:MAG: hypothetical protein NXH75_15250 [Halobacteriovoraceae bacterium]|nr:hypothetical protein [Halobacteriovoraceae bacterium]
MKNLIILVLFSLGFSAHALQFNLSIWEKEQVCQEVLCLPKTLVREGPIEIPEPQFNSFSQLKVPFEGFQINFTLTKREEFGGYYSFQTEIKDSEGKSIALCSRYEAIDTFENAPVGACAGKHPSEDKLLGVSLYKVNP